MRTEDAVTDALRAKAGAVPNSPMPRLGRPAPARRGWLVPVAAAVVVVVATGVAVVALSSRDQSSPATGTTSTTTSPPTSAPSPETLAPGEVYYSVRLTDLGVGGMIQEKELWQPPNRTGEWSQRVAQGKSISGGRVVPAGGRIEAPPGGVCYPAFRPTDSSCTEPGSWSNPTVDFLATAPRDPATITAQLREMAMMVLDRNGQGEDLAPVLELHYVSELLAANGVPAELASALRTVVAGLPGITVTRNMDNPTGQRGTGYSLPHPLDGKVTAIFAEDGHYLGSPKEAVRHGVAPGLGQPPSRMLD